MLWILHIFFKKHVFIICIGVLKPYACTSEHLGILYIYEHIVIFIIRLNNFLFTSILYVFKRYIYMYLLHLNKEYGTILCFYWSNFYVYVMIRTHILSVFSKITFNFCDWMSTVLINTSQNIVNFVLRIVMVSGRHTHWQIWKLNEMT